MPDREDGFTPPSQAEVDAFKYVVSTMLEGNCVDISIPPALSAHYKLTHYVDQQLYGRKYCLFWEHRDVTGDGDYDVEKGLGTFIYNADAMNEVVVTVPHAIFEAPTLRQAVDLFQRAQTRALLLVGVHRYASLELSPCQSRLYDGDWPDPSKHVRSDAAHNLDTFLRVQQTVHQHYRLHKKSYYNIQLHGMGYSTCPQHVYVSNGSNQTTVGKALDLASSIAAKYPEWYVGYKGDGDADCLDGSSNTFARWAGDVSDICAYASHGPAVAEFVHIEQDKYRDPQQQIDLIRDGLKWTPSVIETFNDPAECIVGGQGDPSNSHTHCDEYTPCCSGLGNCAQTGKGKKVYSACIATVADAVTCGNGSIEWGEECDSANLGGATCESLDLGYSGGVLTCTNACSFDTSACSEGAECSDSGAGCGTNGDCCEGLACRGKGRDKICGAQR
jgi:hypothetical protein